MDLLFSIQLALMPLFGMLDYECHPSGRQRVRNAIEYYEKVKAEVNDPKLTKLINSNIADLRKLEKEYYGGKFRKFTLIGFVTDFTSKIAEGGKKDLATDRLDVVLKENNDFNTNTA